MRFRTLPLALSAYALFFVTFVGLLLFVHDIGWSWGVGAAICHGEQGCSLFVDLGLVALFGLQHSVMARPAFKRYWTRVIPEHLERTAYVVASSVALIVLMLLWQPLPALVWDFGGPVADAVAIAVVLCGLVVLLWATFLTDHFELFGLRQTYLHDRGVRWTPIPFKTSALYRHVRHPMMSGMLLLLWATPRMSLGHLVLACGFTVYILIGVYFEERGLLRELGPDYARYRRTTPMLVPHPWRASAAD